MEKDIIDLSDYLRVIRKRKILIIVGTLICTVAAVVINLRTPERYRAKALIKIGQKVDAEIKLPPDHSKVDNPANVRKYITAMYEQNEDNLKYELKAEKVDDHRVGVRVEGADMGRAKEILEGFVNRLSDDHFRKIKDSFQRHKTHYKRQMESTKPVIEDLKEDLKEIQDEKAFIENEMAFIEKEVEKLQTVKEKLNFKQTSVIENLRMQIVNLMEKKWERSKKIKEKKRKLLGKITNYENLENVANEISALEGLDKYKTGVIGGIRVEKATTSTKNKLFVLAAVVAGFTISSILVFFIECVRERGEGKKNLV